MQAGGGVPEREQSDGRPSWTGDALSSELRTASSGASTKTQRLPA
jgi:2-dehydropantoate 2-reductase